MTLGCPARGLVTSFLFLRYRLQAFKVGVDIPHKRGMIFVISWRTRSLTTDSVSN
jgi:hypothetical protein